MPIELESPIHDSTEKRQYRKTRYLLPVILSGPVPELSLRRDASEESHCRDETLCWILAAMHLTGLTRAG